MVDDIDMGLTHIIRGGDHVTNTGAQIALFKALGNSGPDFGHHNLLMDASGEGLSKRKGALSIQSLREDGFEAMAVASLATLIGTGQSVEACATMGDLTGVFDPTKVSKSDAKFDVGELKALSEKLIHEMSYESAQPRLKQHQSDLGEQFWETVKPNLSTISDVSLWRDVVEGKFDKAELSSEDAAYVEASATELKELSWSDDVWSQWTNALKAKTGRKGRALFMPLRQAITGQSHGPDMASLLMLIGQENTIRRLL